MKTTLLYLSAWLLLAGCSTSPEEPAGTSYTGEHLREDIKAEIKTLEDMCVLLGHKGMPVSGDPKFVQYETTLPPKSSKDPWEEIWSVQREGYIVKYEIRFTPLPEGGYKFRAAALFDEDEYK